MGFKLMTNFNTPFFSRNVTEFWRRWHISLSTWFNDYLYTPIVIARRNWGKFAVVFALLVTFFISGLWHGAGWTFIIYGMLHGVAMIYEYLTKKTRKKLALHVNHVVYSVLSTLLTFLFVSFSWIFFRANSFYDATDIIHKIFFVRGPLFIESFAQNIIMPVFFIVVLLVAEFFGEVTALKKYISYNSEYTFVRYFTYCTLIITILLFGVVDGAQFIYFQF